MSNYFDPYFDEDDEQGDPVAILVGLLSKCRRGPDRKSTALSDLGFGDYEDLVMDYSWSALCLAAGLEESASDRVAWRIG